MARNREAWVYPKSFLFRMPSSVVLFSFVFCTVAEDVMYVLLTMHQTAVTSMHVVVSVAKCQHKLPLALLLFRPCERRAAILLRVVLSSTDAALIEAQ